MANSTNSTAWDDIIQNLIPPSQVLRPPFSSDFQSSLDHMSFSDAVDWFPSPENNITNMAVAADSSRRRPSIPKSPSKAPNDSLLSHRRSGQAYISRAEFLSTVRSIVDKLNTLQESLRDVQMKLQTVTSNHKELSFWTVDMNSAITDLAQQVVEKMGVNITEDDEWQMPEEEQSNS